MMRKTICLLVLILGLQTFLNMPSAEAQSIRSKKKFVLSYQTISATLQSLVSVSALTAGYNMSDRFRFTSEYTSSMIGVSGKKFSAIWVSGFGANGKLFLTKTNFAPFIGAGISSFSDASFSGTASSVHGISPHGEAGLDWQADVGFFFSFSYREYFAQTIFGTPLINFGWSF